MSRTKFKKKKKLTKKKFYVYNLKINYTHKQKRKME